MNKQIKISVIGEQKSGKSTIIFLIRNYLKRLGFEVQIDPSPDYDSEELMSFHVHRNFESKVKAVKNKTNIVIDKKVIFNPKPHENN